MNENQCFILKKWGDFLNAKKIIFRLLLFVVMLTGVGDGFAQRYEYRLIDLSATDMSWSSNEKDSKSIQIQGTLQQSRTNKDKWTEVTDAKPTINITGVTNLGTGFIRSGDKVAPSGVNTSPEDYTATASVTFSADFNGNPVSIPSGNSIPLQLTQLAVAAQKQLIHRNPYPGTTSSVITELQPTHVNNIVLYRKTGNVTLSLPVTTDGSQLGGYYRWFDYATETNTIALANETGMLTVDKGIVFYRGLTGYGNGVDVTYTFGGTTKKIACDASSYIDYLVESTKFTEPTLSYRVIYEIKPASELLSAINTGTIQNEVIYAPAGKNVTVRALYDKASFDAALPNPTYLWSSNATAISSTKYLMASVAGGTNGTNKVVTLTGGGETLAKFTIYFVADTEPRTDASINAVTDQNFIRKTSVLNSAFDLIADLDFDTQARVLDGVSDAPLDWSESTYGFFYPQLSRNAKHTHDNPDWSEYALVQNTNKIYPFYRRSHTTDPAWLGSLTDHSKPGAGYYLYVDASEEPGLVANLKFDEWLCQGMDLYVVAWIADMNKEDGERAIPNLNFVLVGINGNTETVLHRFTTGSNSFQHNTKDAKEWYQIFYKVNIQSEDYTSYRLKVENNGTTSSGNDFAIDDIRVYRSKPAMTAFQTDYTCGTGDTKTKAVLRIDYKSLLGTQTSMKLWYRILKDATEVVGKTSVDVYADPSSVAGVKYYNSWNDYNIDTSKPSTFFMKETVPSEKWVLYVIQDELFEPNQIYKAELASSLTDFGKDKCGFSYPFAIKPSISIGKDGVNIDPGKEQSECGSSSFELKPSIIGTKLNGPIGVFEGTAMYDWITMPGAISDGDLTLLKNAIVAFRAIPANQTLTTLVGATVSTPFTQEMLDLLMSYMNEGNLVLYKGNLTYFVPSGVTQKLLIAPIPSTGKTIPTTENPTPESLTICSDPVVLTFIGSLTSNPKLVFGFSDATYPSSNMHGIRISEMYASGNNQYLLPVKTISGTISNVQLFSSTDATAPSSYSVAYDSNVMTLTLTGVNNRFKPGHIYKLLFQVTGVDKCGASTVLPIIIVPTYLTWDPQSGDASTTWNNDKNWRPSQLTDWDTASETPSSFVQLPGNARGFVPMAAQGNPVTSFPPFVVKSNATLPTGAKNYPSLNAWSISTNGHVVSTLAEPNRTPNIEYDIFFIPNAADYIHFEPASELANQHYLNYNKAWVELKLSPDRWYMLSSPFPRVVSGDFHLQGTGVDSRAPFKDISGIDPAASRIHPAVYQKAWENSVTNISKFGDDKTFAFTSNSWITPHNALNEDYKPGSGFAIWADNDKNNDKDVVFRFPKTDASYYYYNEFGVQTSKSQVITRTGDRGDISKLTPLASLSSVDIAKTATGSYIFLLGNPFMSHLDMAKFLAGNSAKLQQKFWIETSDGLNAISITAGKMTSTTGQLFNKLAPMQSFFVEATLNGQTLSGIKFDQTMMVLDSYPSGTPDNPLRTRASEPDGAELRIRAQRNGTGSSILIAQRDNASDTYDTAEDMMVLMDSRSLDRPTLYTITDGQALMIDARRTLGKIPLGIYSDSQEAVTLSFSGVENFDQLSLYDAETKVTTPITSSEVTVQVNGSNAGRYYLNLNRTATDVDEVKEGEIQAYNSAPGVLTVVSSNGMPIVGVEIFTPSGALVEKSLNSDTDLLTFALQKGSYMVRVKNQMVSKTCKVVIK